MNRCLDCIQIWYGCSLGISDDLITFCDESIKNRMAATAILTKLHKSRSSHSELEFDLSNVV